jgi:predicted RNA-binding Zn ribbon-like protein
LINHVAAAADLAPVLAGGIEPAPVPTVPRAVATIARDGVRVFSAGPERIRHCGADDCALIFYDSSRPNARRWCSMQRCGNRTKVRTHRSHRKEHTP